MVNQTHDSLYRREVIAIGYATVVVYTALALFSYSPHDNTLFHFSSTAGAAANWAGSIGANLAALLFFLLGAAAYMLWAASLFPLYVLIKKSPVEDVQRRGLLLLIEVIVAATLCALYGLSFSSGIAGGLLGSYVHRVLVAATGGIGSQLVAWSVLWITVALFARVPLLSLMASWVKRCGSWCVQKVRLLVTRRTPTVASCEGAVKIETFDADMSQGNPVISDEQAGLGNVLSEEARHRLARYEIRRTLQHRKIFQTPVVIAPNSVLTRNIFATPDDALQSPYDIIHEAMRGALTSSFQLPGVDLLDVPPATKEQESGEQLEKRARKVEEKLQHFGINGKVVAIKPGPVVTMFEYKPEIDSKISKILALEDDLAMALSAQSMRILAPIPGRNVIGFEIANEERETVSFARLLASPTFEKSSALLPVALGLDSAGDPIIEDLSHTPHLLVGGATGSGKSVALNTFVLSLLYKKTPEDLKLILIDPKRLEFTPYADIPHLLFPIVTQPARAAAVLAWVAQEMDARYTAMAVEGVRSIAEYHKVDAPDKRAMPYIVVVIDELADLMMVAGKEVETHIVRIAQMARAAGIHLVLATQRPSVEVVTGLIKVNFPSRIAFRVSSKVDSRTILDTQGAERLLGRGDMLLMQASSPELKRVHGAFVTDGEVERVTDFVRAQKSVEYLDLDEILLRNNHANVDDWSDELYEQVREFVLSVDEISISMLQRHYRIGFNRSARLIEKLELDGLVAPAQGSKPRKVLHDKA
jgi:S-DNA-T family DNA segregation ATPase FtsK/SpoIIIE